ncbi:MAG TPA: Fis family transcriptional regulator [Clostridiales bacterium]|nr:Fis family transcriptional regulator [Clostridiales bacterium]
MEGVNKLILDSLHDGVLIIDKDAIVKYVNPAYTRITSVLFDEIVGKPLKNARPGARLPNVLNSGENILRALRMEDGVEYIVNMSPIFDNNKEIIGGISLVLGIKEVLELTHEVSIYKNEIKSLENRIKSIQKARYTFDDIVSEDESSIAVKKMARRISLNDTSVLILGESGTGKELYAQAIHNHSNRKNGPFVAINCAAFNHSLLESELFGYQEGSFTGANKEGKVGLFEAANSGTIFLDEISEMEFNLQSKLLRTLQEGTIRRIGGIKEIPINVRLITASNRDLEDMIKKNEFREDLFYRIAVFPLNILPLRMRKNDIIPLVKEFVKKEENRLRRRIDIKEKTWECLYLYDWPGNIRELKNAIEFAFNMMEDYCIDYKDLPLRVQSDYLKANKDDVYINKLSETIKRIEVQEIKKAISIFGDTIEGKRAAAANLGISLATLYNKIK